jgi:hypothetical protein
MGARSLIERFDLSPCFIVKDGGDCWVVRCRHCAAGWLPQKCRSRGSRGSVPNLLEHARGHGLELRRRPRVKRPIERRLVVRLNGRVIKTIRNRISLARAALEDGGDVTIECTYAAAPAGPPATPVSPADARRRSQLWAAAVDRWLIEQRGGDD